MRVESTELMLWPKPLDFLNRIVSLWHRHWLSPLLGIDNALRHKPAILFRFFYRLHFALSCLFKSFSMSIVYKQ